MLCGPVGPKLKTLLPEEMFIPESCEMNSDENHLILEYQRQEKWGNIEAPIASRFIMSHDVANSALATLESFIGKHSLGGLYCSYVKNMEKLIFENLQLIESSR
jgi:ADP-dependent glucokinase